MEPISPEVLVDIQLKLQHLITLVETKHADYEKRIDANQANIGRAGKDIDKVKEDLSRTKEETHRVADRLELVENQLASLKESSRELSKTVQAHERKMYWVSAISTVGTAVLVGIVMKVLGLH
jgi:chromosome segregation ATPase